MNDEEFRKRYDELMKYAGIEPNIGGKIFCFVHEDGVTVKDILKFFECREEVSHE